MDWPNPKHFFAVGPAAQPAERRRIKIPLDIQFKQADSGNYQQAARGKQDIRYLVIHYTANNGDTAKNNVDYFASQAHSVSAHYFVDSTEIWQSVRDQDIAWHCGTSGTYYHPDCRNENSIAIELCSQKVQDRYSFAPGTVSNAVWLTRKLMAQYEIPVDCVLRHYDVTHKNCPAPFVEGASAWENFLQALKAPAETIPAAPGESKPAPVPQPSGKEEDMTTDEVKRLIEQSRVIYHTIDEVPEWGRSTVEKVTQKGWLSGDNGSNLNLSYDLLRMLVINDRAGNFEK